MAHDVTAVDTARYSEVFARCHIETDGSVVDKDDVREALEYLNALPGHGRLLHRDLLCPIAVLPTVQRREGGCDPRSDRVGLRGNRALPDPADQSHRRSRSRRLDDGTANGLREKVGSSLLQPPRAACARALGGPRAGGPRRCDPGGRRSGRVRHCLPGPSLQPAPLLHQLPHLGDPGGLGRPRPLREGVQAGRRTRGEQQEPVQSQARDARSLTRGHPPGAGPRDGSLVQRRVLGLARSIAGVVLRARPRASAGVRLEALRGCADRHLQSERATGWRGDPPEKPRVPARRGTRSQRSRRWWLRTWPVPGPSGLSDPGGRQARPQPTASASRSRARGTGGVPTRGAGVPARDLRADSGPGASGRR